MKSESKCNIPIGYIVGGGGGVDDEQVRENGIDDEANIKSDSTDESLNDDDDVIYSESSSDDDSFNNVSSDGEHSGDYYTVGGDDETEMNQLENNDPIVREWMLEVDRKDIIRSWERMGRAIGQSIQLRTLKIQTPREGEIEASQLESFYGEVAKNTSVTNLELWEGVGSGHTEPCGMGNIPFVILPFLSRHYRLRKFSVCNCFLDEKCTRFLVSALSACSSNYVQQIELRCHRGDSVFVTEIIQALTKYRGKLSLGFDEHFGKRFCVALACLLQNPKSKVQNLHFDLDCDMSDEGLANLGRGLVGNRRLKLLSIESTDADISSTCWAEFLTQSIGNTASSLEELTLSGSYIGGVGLTALGNALLSNNKLRILMLDHIVDDLHPIGAQAWQSFFNPLQNSQSILEELSLVGNEFGDEVVPHLVDALISIDTLKGLNLYFNRCSRVGLQGISRLLQNPNSHLEELSIGQSDADDTDHNVAIDYSHALLNNTKLKQLLFCRGMEVTASGWDALADLLCNKSSIDGILDSNHTLEAVRGPRSPDDRVVSYLELNEKFNKFEVVRRKIIQYYFINGEANTQEFVDMELGVLPHAMRWTGRNHIGHSLLYQLVRSMPTLFDYESMRAAVRKRKR